MPVAEPFNALGRGNGFPFCPIKRNLNSYGFQGFDTARDWITLGGTRKGNAPTDGEKQLSYINAMKIYWNLYKIKAHADTDNLSIEDPESIVISKNRVCGSSGSNSFLESKFEYIQPEPDGPEIPSESVEMWPSIRIQRLYNGNTDDEENFVGFGLSKFFYLRASYSESGPPENNSNSFAEAELSSYFSENETSSSYQTPSVKYLSGIPFLIVKYEEGSPDWSISGLEFYTY